jgi:hypothetical protein
MPKYAEEQKNIFEGLDPEQIAEQIERDIKKAARKWKREKHHLSVEEAATRAAAMYLHKHTVLYIRKDDPTTTKQNHQHWLDLMRTWFIDA